MTPSYDIIIKGGWIVDGTGGPRYRSDLAIKDGKIARFGRIRDSAGEVIDADGLIVAPGFVDAHTHFDAQVCWDPLATSSSWHGVTSAVMGNCGFTLAPCRPGDAENLMRALEAVEDIPTQSMQAGIDWRWESYAQYLDNLERLPKGINFGGYVGHSALRAYVMGERAFTEEGTPDEIGAMRTELRNAVQAGALGFSTSRGRAHFTPWGTPVPSRIAAWEETRALIAVLGELNGGVLEIARELGPEGIARVREVALTTGVPVTYGLLAFDGARWREWMALSDEVAEGGGKIVLQSHTRPLCTLWSFEGNLPFDRVPGWERLRDRPLEDQLVALEDAELRSELVRAAEATAATSGPGPEAKLPSPEEYERIRVIYSGDYDNPTIAEVARSRGTSPVETVIDLARASKLKQVFAQPLHSTNIDEVGEILRHPRSIATFSDAGAHVSQICDASLPTQLLSYWVRQRRLLSLEAAVRKITYDTATAWGLHDRGLLRQGLAADVAIFDAETVGPGMPEIRRDLPGGAKRLVQPASGMHATLVNGQVLMRDGKHSGAFPGTVLRGPLAAR